MVGIKKHIAHEEIKLELNPAGSIQVSQCQPRDGLLVLKIQNILVCCIYNAPNTSPYSFSSDELSHFIDSMTTMEKVNKCNGSIITGDINFESTDWAQVTSTDEYQERVLCTLLENNFDNVNEKKAIRQLDVVLTNNPDLVSTSRGE